MATMWMPTVSGYSKDVYDFGLWLDVRGQGIIADVFVVPSLLETGAWESTR